MSAPTLRTMATPLAAFLATTRPCCALTSFEMKSKSLHGILR
eukprot:SAG25_NODE_6452_length_558_cov_1.389978_1_plen_41_part_10